MNTTKNQTMLFVETRLTELMVEIVIAFAEISRRVRTAQIDCFWSNESSRSQKNYMLIVGRPHWLAPCPNITVPNRFLANIETNRKNDQMRSRHGCRDNTIISHSWIINARTMIFIVSRHLANFVSENFFHTPLGRFSARE